MVYFGDKSTSGAGEDAFFGTLSASIILRNWPYQAAMIRKSSAHKLRMEEVYSTCNLSRCI